MEERLAIEGGNPVRKEVIYYGRQWIEEVDIRAVSDVLSSDFITCGPEVVKLEEDLCRYTGAKYAVVVNSGTSALHCACIAAGISADDEVITTPLTFAASANCALYCNAKPVFADVDPETYNIAPESIRERITEKTKAVVAVDFAGQAVKIDEIKRLCADHGMVFIEDAAHSIGTRYKGVPIGSLADMTCFSFHPVKTITGGEGGAILTNDGRYYEKLLLARTHGITHDEMLMQDAPHEGPWCYEQISLGFNYRLTDFQAALLRSQLRRIEAFIARRKAIVARYDAAFSEMSEIIAQKEIAESDTCRHLYVIRLDLDSLDCTRREFFDAMSAENVQCQVHYVPIYWFPYYQQLGYKRGICPNAEKVYECIMSIPLYPMMSDRDVEDVIHAVRKIVKRYSR